MNHTEEPWVAEKTLQGRDSSISNMRGKTIAIAYQNENIDGDDLANANRIVACVNACADVEDDCLEQGYVKWLQQRIVDLELSVKNLEEENARIKAMNNHLVINGEWEDV